MKLPTPNAKLSPPATFNPLYPSRKAMRTVFIMGHTVNTSYNTIAGARYSHAFHFCLPSTIFYFTSKRMRFSLSLSKRKSLCGFTEKRTVSAS